MIQLDRKRPYGQVFGSANVGYEQDGKSFDHDGVLIADEKPPKPAKPEKQAPAASDQLADQLKA